MALIELENVEVSYGRIKALAGISCRIDGGAVGLLGPNGAGKSTMLKTLLGFLRAESGTVKIFGRSMPGNAIKVRQQLGYMPEKDIVSPRVSAVSFLTYCGELFGMTRPDAMERAHEVLNYVGMNDERYRKMETYSTGMCQRVKFAQALVHDPKLLLLDEPTNGLDPEGRIEMLELIRELARKRQVATLLSSHLLPDVEHVCDRVIVINKGRTVRDGSIWELTALQDGLIELRVRDNKTAFLEQIEREGCSWNDEQNGNVLISKPANLEIRSLFEIARAHGTQIRHLRPVRRRLEEVFMDAIREEREAQPHS
jgi:ABC-2 type transport system ATP-binding protein